MRTFFRSIAARIRRPSKFRYKVLAITGSLFSYDRREEMLDAAFSFVNHGKVDGDYLEFGVWKGGSLSVAYHMSRRAPRLSGMRFLGFDSFEGLPEIQGIDTDTGEFAKGDYAASKETVEGALVKSGVDMTRFSLIKGWFNATLTDATRKAHNLRAASIVYIDCDLYESTVPVLEFITPLLVDGTIIIFDDWFCFRGHPERGEQKAFAEWQTKYNIRTSQYKTFGWTGNSFIVHR